MKRIFSFLVMTIALSTLLISCGGGGGGTPPSAFELVSPTNGATGGSLTPIFQWTDSTGESSYILQGDTDRSFSNPAVFTIPADTTSFPFPSETLSPETTYYWRVIAVNSAGQTIASNAPFSFTTTGFAKTYGGTGYDEAYSIQQTSDDGYIVAGATYSFGADYVDFWVLKLDSDGDPVWEKTYGGTDYDAAYSIQQTSDGGYIVAGVTYSSGNGDFWVLKLRSDGTIVWQNTYGGTDYDGAYSIQQTSDGYYIVAGVTGSFGAGSRDFWVLKLRSSDGSIVWEKTYGGTDYDGAYSIQQTSDGYYIVAGVTYSSGNGDFWVLKLRSSDGTIVWQNTYGGTDYDAANSIQETSDGGYIVAGRTDSSGNGDFWVLKLDSGGLIEWQKTYGVGDYDFANSIQQTSDGGYIVAGVINSSGASNGDFWVLKLDSDGSIVWQYTFGGTDYDEANSIQQTSDGGYIVAGVTKSFGAGNGDFWVLKLDSDGSIVFNPASGAKSPGTSAAPSDTGVAPAAAQNVTETTTSAMVSDTDVTPEGTNATIRQQAP